MVPATGFPQHVPYPSLSPFSHFPFYWYLLCFFPVFFRADIIQLLHVSSVRGFVCLLCQAIDVVLLVCLDVSLDLFVGFCNSLCPCLFRCHVTVVYYGFLPPS